MTEIVPKTGNQFQQTHPLHYYHDIKWRLLAEAPWLVIMLGLIVIMTLVSGGKFTPDTIPSIIIPGVLLIPMIMLIASGDIDLSSGILAGLTCEILIFPNPYRDIGMTTFISLLVALTVGLTHGLLVGFVKLKGVYVTLGMSYFLFGLVFMFKTLMIPVAPPWLRAFSHSPFILWLWILLVIVCAAIMIFIALGRHPLAGEPESPGRKGSLYKGSLFVFSSLMAWISGNLLLNGYVSSMSSPYLTEIVVLAALMGGTAYYAGTGFVLSGAAALVAIVLFRQMPGFSPLTERIIWGMLILILPPIAQYYHVGLDRLYCRQNEKTKALPSESHQ